MTVIELGDVSAEPAPDAPVRRGLPRGAGRYGTAVVAALCLLLVSWSGSGPPPQRALQPLWSVPFDGDGAFTVTDRTVYVMGDQIVAYDLATGAKKWTGPPTSDGQWLEDFESAGAMLTGIDYTTIERTAADGSTFNLFVNLRTRAVDARTGRTLWQQDGEAYGRTADAVLLTTWTAPDRRLAGMRLVRIADGTELWSKSWSKEPAAAYEVVRLGADPVRPEQLATIGKDGTTEVFSTTDGTRLSRGKLPGFTGATAEMTGNVTGGRDGTLLVSGSGSVVAYDSRTFQARWRADRVTDGSLTDCGLVLCLTDADARLTGRDWLTGREVWRTDEEIAGFQMTIGGDRLFVQSRLNSEWVVLDQATGRTIARGGATRALIAGDGSVLTLDGQTYAPFDHTVSRLDLRTGRLQPRGSIGLQSDDGGGAWSAAGKLIYRSRENRLVVMAVG